MSETKFRHDYLLETIRREGWAHLRTHDNITEFREVLRGNQRVWRIMLIGACIAYCALLVFVLRPIPEVERTTITQEAFEVAAQEALDDNLPMTTNYYCTVIQGQLPDDTYYELQTIDTARLARQYPLDGLTRSRIECVNILVADQMQFREQATGRINWGMALVTLGFMTAVGSLLFINHRQRRIIELHYEGEQPVIIGLDKPMRPQSHDDLSEALTLRKTSVPINVMVAVMVAYFLIGLFVGHLIISIVTA